MPFGGIIGSKEPETPKPEMVRLQEEILKRQVNDSLRTGDDVVDTYYFKYDIGEVDQDQAKRFVENVSEVTQKNVMLYTDEIEYVEEQVALEQLEEMADHLGYDVVPK